MASDCCDVSAEDSMFWFPDPYPEDQIPVVSLRRQDDRGRFLPLIPRSRRLVCQQNSVTSRRERPAKVRPSSATSSISECSDVNIDDDDLIIDDDDEVSVHVEVCDSPVSSCEDSEDLQRGRSSSMSSPASAFITRGSSRCESPGAMSESQKHRLGSSPQIYRTREGIKSVNLNLMSVLGRKLYMRLYNSRNLADAKRSLCSSVSSSLESLVVEEDVEVKPQEPEPEVEVSAPEAVGALPEGMSPESQQSYADYMRRKQEKSANKPKLIKAGPARNAKKWAY